MEKDDIIINEGKPSEGKAPETKTPERLYSKAELEAAKERTALAVEKRLRDEFGAEIQSVKQDLAKSDAKKTFKKLNGNPERLDALIKLENIDLTSKDLKETLTKGLEKYPEFRENKLDTKKEKVDETPLEKTQKWKQHYGW